MATLEQDPQRTREWHRARLGKITGSRVGDLMGRGKSKEHTFTQTGWKYLLGVAGERMLDRMVTEDDSMLDRYIAETSVTSKAMRIGTEREDEALDLYAMVKGAELERPSSVEHPGIAGFASSPDAVVYGGALGTVEVKCPTPGRYMEMRAGVRDAESLKRAEPLYYWQCVSHMAVTGAGWCDFTVYCCWMRKPLHIVRIERDEAEVKALEDRVREGLAAVEAMIND